MLIEQIPQSKKIFPKKQFFAVPKFSALLFGAGPGT